jgi:hypothetical protein
VPFRGDRSAKFACWTKGQIDLRCVAPGKMVDVKQELQNVLRPEVAGCNAGARNARIEFGSWVTLVR